VKPAFTIIQKQKLYKWIPESQRFPDLKFNTLRIFIVLMVCYVAYIVPNLGQFINFTGAVAGTLVSFVFPVIFYWKAHQGRVGYFNILAG